MNTVTANFDTTVRQMTKTFQWSNCLSKKMIETSQRKKQVQLKCHEIISFTFAMIPFPLLFLFWGILLALPILVCIWCSSLY